MKQKVNKIWNLTPKSNPKLYDIETNLFRYGLLIPKSIPSPYHIETYLFQYGHFHLLSKYIGLWYGTLVGVSFVVLLKSNLDRGFKSHLRKTNQKFLPYLGMRENIAHILSLKLWACEDYALIFSIKLWTCNKKIN